MYEVRLFLSKKDRMKYVSHLDMFRLMQRAVRRADIPLWYTEGFNPHPYISFLLALSLGIEGEKEPLDIRITDETPIEEIAKRLNDVMPEGLTVTKAAVPKYKPKEIAYGEYDVVFNKSDISEEALFKALTSGQLTCEKSGKSKGRKVMKSVSISEHIKNFSIAENDNQILLNVVLPAGSVFNLNPLQLAEGLGGYIGKTVTPESVIRKCLRLEDMTEFE